MLKKIAIAVVVLVAGFLIFVATRPDTFTFQRSVSIKAPPEKIFAFIDDFHRWESWSPFEHLDPGLERTFGGAASGKGAVYDWKSSAGWAGRMEITNASPPSSVTIKADVAKPYVAHDIAEFTLVPAGDSTKVTYTLRGPNPYLSRLLALFSRTEENVEQYMETVLAGLKATAEAP